ncbi:DUF2155 domain-containing protein [Sinorhizobium sp. M103]|nr:DUF2155 domain-containing protein [Sinorhizobium sp. M103]WEJ11240.1 DUF2155 domain-containing protein [Sinorhizobium sp. M103]
MAGFCLRDLIGRGGRFAAIALLLAAPVTSTVETAQAARLSNAVAVFSGIDKITGRITSFDVYIGETVQFGALQVTPRVCHSRDETEAPKTTTFVEVDEITLDRKIRRIFTGWMFADSPGLNAVEHPVYDVWLQSCKTSSDVPRRIRRQSNRALGKAPPAILLSLPATHCCHSLERRKA